MNLKIVLKIIGTVLFWESVLMTPSLFIALIDNSFDRKAFLISIVITGATGLLLKNIRAREHSLRKREAFASVAICWLVISLFGALPYYISGITNNYLDALFETVSGFTTTGATIFKNVESLPRSILFWRSFTLWIGGMGVLVFTMALAPSVGARSIFLMEAEHAGLSPGKLVPKLSDTAKILYTIYTTMTLITVIIFLIVGMPFFDAVIHAFGTAGTGGYSIKANSIGHYNSVLLEWITAVLMLMFGINFSLYYVLLKKDRKKVLRNEELRFYGALVIVATVLIFINILPLYDYSIADSLRNAAFQVTAITTTTGFSIADLNTWPMFSKSLLLLLMFTGACTGSTTGGMKLIRIIILFKSVLRELKQIIHPGSISKIRIDDRTIDNDGVRSILIFFVSYIFVLFVTVLVLSLENYDFMTTFSAALSSISNIGMGYGLIGPMGNFSEFSYLSKITMMLSMLIGRLEVLPVIALLSPSMWHKQ